MHNALLLEVDDSLHGGTRLESDVRGKLQPLQESALALGPGSIIITNKCTEKLPHDTAEENGRFINRCGCGLQVQKSKTLRFGSPLLDLTKERGMPPVVGKTVATWPTAYHGSLCPHRHPVALIAGEGLQRTRDTSWSANYVP